MAASTAIRATAAGWSAPLQWTVTSGGNTVEWYSPRLAATTLRGVIQGSVWASESNVAANVTVRLQVEVVNNAGTLVSTFGAANANVELALTTATKVTINVAGPDTTIAAGNRLRFRFFIDDYEAAMATGHTATLSYNVATAGASGDSYIELPVALNAFVVSLAQTSVSNTTTFGAPTVTRVGGAVTLTTTAVNDSTDAFGTVTVTRGAVTVTATAVDDSTDAFGSPAVSAANLPPATPSITNVALDTPTLDDVTLTASAYSDPNSDPSGGRRWRVYMQLNV